MILDGRVIRDKIIDDINQKVEKDNLNLTLAIIYIGDNKASELYVNNKIKYAKKAGIKTKLFYLAEDIKEEYVIKLIKELNEDKDITGMIIQSPIPNTINFENCIKYINPKKDIDGFTKENFYNLVNNIDSLRPCTPKGIIRLLDYYKISIASKKVCIIGRGKIVGKPLFFEMNNRNATVTICNSHTVDLKKYTKNADIIVACCGKPKLLKKEMVKKNSVVIDVGISFVNGKQVGDTDYDKLKDKCHITPNPGGIGPMTIAMVLENVLEAYLKGGK